MISRNDPCWCNSGAKWKKCHFPLQASGRAGPSLQEQYAKQWGILLKTPEQIDGIRRASQLSATILKKVCLMAQAGITTNQLDAYAVKLYQDAGAIAATLGYGSPPFSKSICTSLNEVICHGIPDETILKEGDILNIDVTAILDGYYGDCSAMVIIGKTSEEKKRVVKAAYDCLMSAIAILKPGVLIYEIGDAIESCAEKYHCSVVHQFVAHGVGVHFHEAPQVPHHANRLAIPLAAGMTFTIEPMINIGVPEAVIDSNDHWTARTADGKPSAQWEHTLLITDTGHEILTQPQD